MDTRNSKQQVGTEEEKNEGFMPVLNTVYDLKLELWHRLKPLEYYLVDVIIDKTIKWNVDEAQITIKELMARTKQDHTRIYRVLKSLESKKIIVRRKENHDLIIGLNPQYFGNLLIATHREALEAKRSKIKVVVDNSKSMCTISTGFVHNQHNNCAELAQNLCAISTEKHNQVPENIEESSLLKTLLKNTLNTFLKDSPPPVVNRGELHSLQGGKPGRRQQLEDPVLEKERQLAEARLAGII